MLLHFKGHLLRTLLFGKLLSYSIVPLDANLICTWTGPVLLAAVPVALCHVVHHGHGHGSRDLCVHHILQFQGNSVTLFARWSSGAPELGEGLGIVML